MQFKLYQPGILKIFFIFNELLIIFCKTELKMKITAKKIFCSIGNHHKNLLVVLAKSLPLIAKTSSSMVILS